MLIKILIENAEWVLDKNGYSAGYLNTQLNGFDPTTEIIYHKTYNSGLWEVEAYLIPSTRNNHAAAGVEYRQQRDRYGNVCRINICVRPEMFTAVPSGGASWTKYFYELRYPLS